MGAVSSNATAHELTHISSIPEYLLNTELKINFEKMVDPELKILLHC